MDIETEIEDSIIVYMNTKKYDKFNKDFKECDLSKLSNETLNNILLVYMMNYQRYPDDEINDKILQLVKLPNFVISDGFFKLWSKTANPENGFDTVFKIYIDSGKSLDENFIISFLSQHLEIIYLKQFHEFIKITNETVILLILFFGYDYNKFHYLSDDIKKLDTISDDLLNIMIYSRCFENPHKFNDDKFTREIESDNINMYEYLVFSKKTIPTIKTLEFACATCSTDLVDFLINYSIKPTQECLKSLIELNTDDILSSYYEKYNIHKYYRHKISPIRANYIVDKLCSHGITLNVKDVTNLLRKSVVVKDFYKYNIAPDNELFETCLILEKWIDYFKDFEITQERSLFLVKKCHNLKHFKYFIENKNIIWNIEHLKIACKFSTTEIIKYLIEQKVSPDIECLHILCKRNFYESTDLLDIFLGTVEPDIICLKNLIGNNPDKRLHLVFNMVYSKLISCNLSNRLFEIKKPCEEKCMISLTDLHGHQYEECTICHKPYLLEYLLKWLCIDNKCPNCQNEWKWNDKVFIYL